MHVKTSFHTYPHCHNYIHTHGQAVFVPMQGILNAAVYGWTREEFLDIMTSHQIQSGQDTPEEEDQLLEDSRRMDRESFEQSMSLSLSRDQRVNEGRKVEVDVITPLSPWSS